MNKDIIKIIFIGLTAALFFSSTFILNRYIALDGSHWFWSASLRYIYMIIILSFSFIIFKGYKYFISLLKEFINHYIFWSMAGSIGFGVFYALITYVASSSPAWVVASTWQFTIISSLIILSFFGKYISKKTWILIFIMFLGICLINYSQLSINNIKEQIFNIILIIIASFAYPLGNQLVWEAQHNENYLKNSNKDLFKNVFSKVYLLSLGTLPFWLLLSLCFEVGVPTQKQYIFILIVAIFSGLIATSLFLYARSKANTASKIVLVDSTQTGEGIFTLLIEIIFLNLLFPSSIAIIGIIITLTALILLSKE